MDTVENDRRAVGVRVMDLENRDKWIFRTNSWEKGNGEGEEYRLVKKLLSYCCYYYGLI